VRVVVADASSLILAAKCEVLRPYAGRVEIIVPREVVREVATPELRRRHVDAMRIAEAIDEGLLRVASVRSRRKLPLALGRGEAAAIRLFLQERADLLLTDDGRAIRTCRLLAIPFTTTPRVVVDLHRDGALDTATARRALEKLAVVGRYTREIIAAALVALRET
jgi:predicted nucleic acid-binding protein